MPSVERRSRFDVEISFFNFLCFNGFQCSDENSKHADVCKERVVEEFYFDPKQREQIKQSLLFLSAMARHVAADKK